MRYRNPELRSVCEEGHEVTARRGAAVRTAVLTATLDELAERGFAALTMDNVATRAGVHKTTVYRRWPDRESLVTDAVLEVASQDFPVPDTGSLDDDLVTWLRTLGAWLGGQVGRPLVAMLTSDAARLPAIGDAKRAFFTTRVGVLAQRLEVAVAAGQLPRGVDAVRLLGALVAPLYLNLLVVDRPVTPEDCDRAARAALLAARAGLLS